MMRRVFTGCMALAAFGTPFADAIANDRISPYGQDAVYFEYAAQSAARAPRPQLERVYAGVVTHHTPNAAPLIVDFYARLARLGPVETIVIVGPDHFERGRGPVSVSTASYRTPFGIVHPDTELIEALVDGGYVTHDEAPFNDHAIHSQLLAITRVLPHATIVPLLFRSKGSNEDAMELGRFLASVAGPRTVVVASVDFSHYLTTQRARPLDVHAARTLATLRPELAGVAEADSPQALTAMMSAARAMGATVAQTIGVYNSDQFSGRRTDVTTGYVSQYFGTPRDYGRFTGLLERMRYDGSN